MKRAFLGVLIVFISLGWTGCGHSNSSAPQTTTTQILSDPAFDGSILETFPAQTLFIRQGMTQNVQSVYAGIDPDTNTEYRAFLDFPLSGVGGVPENAIIESAILDIVINSISPQPLSGTIPIRIDLISFQPPTLFETDFDRSLQPALATITITPPISEADFGNHVPVDVTSLMNEVQRLGLADFQIRILEDAGAVTPGLIEITDTTGANRGNSCTFIGSHLPVRPLQLCFFDTTTHDREKNTSVKNRSRTKKTRQDDELSCLV